MYNHQLDTFLKVAELGYLWPQVFKELPGTTLKLVTFENTPENAARILANLGEDIDIVADAFDDVFLTSRGCAALELSRELIRIAVPSTHLLAEKEMLTEQDLEGERIFIIQRGWNEETDRLT